MFIECYLKGFAYAMGAGLAILSYWILVSILSIYLKSLQQKILLKSLKGMGLKPVNRNNKFGGNTDDNLRRLEDEGKD